MRNASALHSLFVVMLLCGSSSDAIYGQPHVWKQSIGPTGGPVTILTSYQQSVYAGTYGGVFVSADNGQTWIQLGPQGEQVTDIVFLNSTMFVSTYGNGIFRGPDFGTSWSQCFTGVNLGGLQLRYITNLTTIDSLMLASVENCGVWRSTDKGDTWTQSDSGMDNSSVRNLFTVGRVILASSAGGSGSGMFRSTDAGQWWARLDSNPYAWNAERMCQYGTRTYGVDYTNSAKVFVSEDLGLTWSLPTGATAPDDIITSIFADGSGLYAGTYMHGVFRSINGTGAVWTSTSTRMRDNSIGSLTGFQSHIYAGTNAGIYVSSDAGGLWILQNDGLTNTLVSSLVRIDNSCLAGTWGGGVLISDDSGRTWQETPVYPALSILDLFTFNNGVYALASGGIYCSSNKGASWNRWGSSLPSSAQSLAANPSYVFAATASGVYRSDLSGQSWVKVLDGNFPDPRTIETVGTSTVVASYYGTLYRSTDNGGTWSSTRMGFLSMVLKYIDETLYAGNAQVNVMYASRDSGKTWRDLNVPLANAAVKQITGEGAFLAVGLSNHAGVIASFDSGKSWQRYNCNLLNTDVRAVCFMNGILIAGTWGNGIYRVDVDSSLAAAVNVVYPVWGATDVATTVQLFWSAVVDASWYRVQVSESPMFDWRVVMNTHTVQPNVTVSGLRGMTGYYWRYQGVALDGYEWPWMVCFFTTRVIIPDRFQLFQNYPNPFNPVTNISFDIPAPTFTSVKVYDLLGREVATIVSEVLSAGKYTRQWDAAGFPSGVYFYRLETGSFAETKKLLLVK